MSCQFDFKGKTVFVSGGTSGINLGIAEGFVEAGARVAVMSRNAERVTAAREQLSRPGRPAIGEVGDVRDFESVKRALKTAHDAFGDIDVLVSGAAGNFLQPALNLSPNGFKVVVDIDLIGTFHVLRAGFDFLRKPGASIINITAPQSFNPAPMQVHVCAAKAGLDQVMRVLALEWGEYGVRVNSISPGPIDKTGGLDKLISDADVKSMSERIPARRLGTRDDIAQMAMFLGSPQASYVTGALIPVDGGLALIGGRGHAPNPEPTPRNQA